MYLVLSVRTRVYGMYTHVCTFSSHVCLCTLDICHMCMYGPGLISSRLRLIGWSVPTQGSFGLGRDSRDPLRFSPVDTRGREFPDYLINLFVLIIYYSLWYLKSI